jgi:DNA-binding response OmpR family regulator
MATILLIDDDRDLGECLQLVLQAEGFDAITASNGLEGIYLARKLHPDLVLCDIDMPDTSGYAVLEAIQSDPITADIPLIFLSGRDQTSDFRQGMVCGAENYLPKPITASDLLAAISVCLQKQERQQKRIEALGRRGRKKACLRASNRTRVHLRARPLAMPEDMQTFFHRLSIL